MSADASKVQSANIANQNVTLEHQRLRRRILLLSGIVAYVALFQWIYEYYLYPTWDYYGFHYNPPPWPYLALGWLLSVTPGSWMPLELVRPSQLAYWVLYITVFIPSMFVPLYVGLDTPGEISLLMVTLFAGLAIVGGSYLPTLPAASHTSFHAVFLEGFCMCHDGAGFLVDRGFSESPTVSFLQRHL